MPHSGDGYIQTTTENMTFELKMPHSGDNYDSDEDSIVLARKRGIRLRNRKVLLDDDSIEAYWEHEFEALIDSSVEDSSQSIPAKKQVENKVPRTGESRRRRRAKSGLPSRSKSFPSVPSTIPSRSKSFPSLPSTIRCY